MYKILAIVAAFAAGATTANAQSAGEFYGGVGLSAFSGEHDYDGEIYDIEGNVPSFFVGGDWNMGTYTLGAELAFIGGSVFETGYEDEYQYTSLIDLKARIGSDLGTIAPYGVVGVSTGTFEFGDPESEESVSGFLVGAGVSYDVTAQFGVGFEFLSRQMDLFEADNISGDVQSLSLRGYYNF